ncbi:flagellar hook-associated protein FlgK [Xanthomonas campestris pv. phormiicola]|nr:flagellar hook-associated protein FlgK [Xanthomonas campestris pv. phormiicola]UYC17849.1 flagellar hook-associated protein FlgK [Xanthomonas campestris pv. phormiicola]
MSMLSIGLSGIQAAQLGLNMSARNTANMKTEGYSRQGVSLVADSRGGVEVASLVRYGDAYRSRQLWSALSSEGEYAASDPYFHELESTMGSTGGSAGEGVDAFFAALNEVSTDPTSVPLRQQVITAAQSMGTRFNSLRDALKNQLDTVAQQAVAMSEQVGALAATVADLNTRISEAAATKSATSELMDQRDLALGGIAKLIDVQVGTQPDGTLSVSLRNGVPLVLGGRSAKLLASSDAGGALSLNVSLDGASYPLASGSIGGQIGGLDDYAKVVAEKMNDAKTLITELANRVNERLTAGFGSNGAPGLAMFTVDADSGRVAVNAALTPAALGASAAADTPGNSDNLASVIALSKNKLTMPGLGEVSITDAYTLMVGKLGSESAANKAALSTASIQRQQAEANLSSVSGVSSEEEVVSVSELLQSYQANMKVISVANEIIKVTLDAF